MKDLLPAEVYKRKDKIVFAVPNNKFNSSKVREYFYELLNNTEDGSIQFINKQMFMDEYFSKSNDTIMDWKFWMTISTILWLNKFHLNEK